MVEEIYNDFFIELKNKAKRRENALKNALSWLALSFIFLIPINILNFFPFLEPTQRLIASYSITGFGLFCLILFFYMIFEQETITFRERLFYHFLKLYTNLEKFSENIENYEFQENAIGSLDRISEIISMYFIPQDTGFDSDKLTTAIKKLNENIPRFKEEINSSKQEIIKKYTLFFKNIMIDCYNGKTDDFLNKIENEYTKPEKNKINKLLDRVLTLSSRSLIKWICSFTITSIICCIIVWAFNMSLWSDLGSALSTIVAFSLITGGIKKFILDPIDAILSKDKN